MGIGASITRQDAVEKVTGAAKYTEDLLPWNSLVAKIVRSTVANGLVTSINTKRAEALEGVEAVVTCFDVPEIGFATPGHPYSLDSDHTDIKDRRLLNRRVRYYGDDVAVVVAVDTLTAQKAAELIEIEYEVYTPVLNVPAGPGSCPIHDEYPKGVMGELNFDIDESGTLYSMPDFHDSRLEGEAYVEPDLFTNVFFVPPVHHAHIENIACFAYGEGRRMTVVSATQVPHIVRRIISEALGDISLGDIRVIKPYVGGGFGNKQDILYEPLAVYLSRKLRGRCVSIILNREETFQNSRTRHAMRIGINLAVGKDDRFTMRKADIWSNQGAYAAHGHAVAASAICNLFQLYPTKNCLGYGRSFSQYSNLPAAGAMRGYGIPQICFAVESQIDNICEQFKVDPIELRKKNMMKPGDADPFSPIICRSNGLDECIDTGIQKMEWYRKREEYQEYNKTSSTIKKGIGMAIFAYKTSVYPISVETASCRIILNQDGSIQIQVGATEIGQGSDTGFLQMASEVLTIPSAPSSQKRYCQC